jgi:ribosomal-protein-alanine N-acetyltransferase
LIAPARETERGAVVIEPMRPRDVPEVVAIESHSFPSRWPDGAYLQELEGNPNAIYFVARLLRLATPWRHAPVIGYAGLWMQHDEAHICTLAVDARYRRRGVGRRLLVRLLDSALERNADIATLEVRAGNVAAQELYRRFGFDVVGERRRYYTDTGEDALIMTTPPLATPDWRRLYAAARLGGSEHEEQHE